MRQNITVVILSVALFTTSFGWFAAASRSIKICEIAKANRAGEVQKQRGAQDEAFGLSQGDEAPPFAEAQCSGEMTIKRDENGRVKWFSVLVLKSEYDIRVQDTDRHHNVVLTRKANRQLVDVLKSLPKE